MGGTDPVYGENRPPSLVWCVVYGEASRDVHTLIHVAAQRSATKHWRLLGARSQGEVHGFYVAQLRRGLWQSFAIACPLPGATAVSLRFRSNPRPVSGLPDVIVLDRESPRLLPRSQTGSPS